MSVLNYNKIQSPRKRKGIIDSDRLMALLGFENYEDLKDAHIKWVDSAMPTNNRCKENQITAEQELTLFLFSVLRQSKRQLYTSIPN